MSRLLLRTETTRTWPAKKVGGRHRRLAVGMNAVLRAFAQHARKRQA
jgi:hypothetical protein